MAKKIFYILHGLGADPDDNWFPWLKKELENKGHKVIVPEFPYSVQPRLSEWLDVLGEAIKVNGVGVIIGHSLGGTLAIHYILSGGKAKKVILVAPPFFHVDYLPKLAPIDKFLDLPENIDNLNFVNNDFVVFYSNDDPMIPHSHGEEWVKILNAKQVVLHKGHFTIFEFPEILEYLD